MHTLGGHGVFLDPAVFPDLGESTRGSAITAAREHLAGEGHDEQALDRAMASARAEMIWWSDRLGFTHDCACHDPGEAAVETCDPAARQVPVVLIEPEKLDVPAAAASIPDLHGTP